MKNDMKEDDLDLRWEKETCEVVDEVIFLSRHTAASNRVLHLKEGESPPHGGKQGWAALPSSRIGPWFRLLKKLVEAHSLVPEFEGLSDRANDEKKGNKRSLPEESDAQYNEDVEEPDQEHDDEREEEEEDGGEWYCEGFSLKKPHLLTLALPQVQQASLARFLEKRRDRVTSVSPYSLDKKSSMDCRTPLSEYISSSLSSAA
ncbi:unnamed protein product [Cochlearia groenlandica]